MSGLSGLFTGLQDAKDRRYAQALQKQQDVEKQAQLGIENKRYSDEDTARAAQLQIDNARNAIIDQNTATTNAAKAASATADAAQTASNKKFEGGLQLPKGWSRLSDDDKVNYLQQRQSAAQKAGDDTVMKQTQDEINGLGLRAQRDSSASLNTARIPLIQAQAAAARDLPARAREIAKGHDDAAIERTAATIFGANSRAQLSATSRMAVAQLQGNTRLNVERMVGAYALTGKSADEGVRLSIAELNAQARMYSADESAGGTPTPPTMPLTQNFYGGGSGGNSGNGGGVSPQLQSTIDRLDQIGAPPAPPQPGPRPVPPKPGARPVAARPPAPPPPGNGDPVVQQFMAQAKQKHWTAEQMQSSIAKSLQQNIITPAEAKAISASIGSVALKGGGGGGGFGAPFPPSLPR